MFIDKENKVRNRLMTMTGDEIIALAKTQSVVTIVQSGLDNYMLFHELVVKNRQFPARELHKYPNIFSLN